MTDLERRVKWRIVRYLVGKRTCVINAHIQGGLLLDEAGSFVADSYIELPPAQIAVDVPFVVPPGMTLRGQR